MWWDSCIVCPAVGRASKLIAAMYQLKKHLLILLLMFESACDETDAHTCTNCTQKPGVSSEFEWQDGCTSIRYIAVLHAQVRHEYVLRDGCTTSGLWGRAPAVFPPPGSITKTSILFSITIIIIPIIINNMVLLSFFFSIWCSAHFSSAQLQPQSSLKLCSIGLKFFTTQPPLSPSIAFSFIPSQRGWTPLLSHSHNHP